MSVLFGELAFSKMLSLERGLLMDAEFGAPSRARAVTLRLPAGPCLAVWSQGFGIRHCPVPVGETIDRSASRPSKGWVDGVWV